MTKFSSCTIDTRDGVARKYFKKMGAPVVIMGKFSMKNNKPSLASQLYEHLCIKFAVSICPNFVYPVIIQSSTWKHCTTESCPTNAG